MQTTIQLLDAAKKAAGIESDYAFGKKFGFSVQTISGWRQGHRHFNDDAAEIIAELLGKEPGEVMAICQAERAKTPKSRTRWLRAAALIAAAMGHPGAQAGSAPFSHNNLDNVDYVKSRRRFLERVAASLGIDSGLPYLA